MFVMDSKIWSILIRIMPTMANNLRRVKKQSKTFKFGVIIKNKATSWPLAGITQSVQL